MHIMLSNAYVGVYFACADDGIGKVRPIHAVSARLNGAFYIWAE